MLGATGNARPHGPAAPGRPRPAPAPGLATAPLAGGGEHRGPWNCLMSHVLTPRPSHRARGDRVPFSSAVASASTMAVTARCPQATADTFGGVSASGDPELQSSPAEFTERSGIRSGAISRNTGPRDKGGHLSLKSRHRVEVGNLVSHLGSAPPGSGLSLFSQQTDSCSKAELGPHVCHSAALSPGRPASTASSAATWTSDESPSRGSGLARQHAATMHRLLPGQPGQLDRRGKRQLDTGHWRAVQTATSFPRGPAEGGSPGAWLLGLLSSVWRVC